MIIFGAHVYKEMRQVADKLVLKFPKNFPTNTLPKRLQNKMLGSDLAKVHVSLSFS